MKVRKKVLAKYGDQVKDHWLWDSLAIAIAIILGFGPYALLSFFGKTQDRTILTNVKDKSLAPLQTDRSPASTPDHH
jgi:hypothetical protein